VKEVKIIGLLYSRPLRGVGLILDRGNIGWAALLAIGATLLVHMPFSTLLLMALVFTPVAALTAAKLAGAVSAGVALERDFMPALVCCLMAWTVALLPLVALRWLVLLAPPIQMALLLAALIYFLGLSVCALRTVAGTSFPRAAVAVILGVVVAGAALWVLSFAGSFAYLFASPWVLYYLYLRFGSEVRGFGGGLGSRQRLRQLLETATVNPRDADAHYQLGLIYEQRRDWPQAKQRFREAIQIDPSDADSHYRLGRILRCEGAAPRLEHLKDALEQFRAAVAIDDKHSSSEVWREIGGTYLEIGENEAARQALREYTNRRPFDAEGLYWYGIALERLGETAPAREAFENACEAVRTAPKHRQRQIHKWETMAARELRRL
jgi:tetratricopeptide (TPR) repeat protein